MDVPDEWLPRKGFSLPYKTRLTDRLVLIFMSDRGFLAVKKAFFRPAQAFLILDPAVLCPAFGLVAIPSGPIFICLPDQFSMLVKKDFTGNEGVFP